MCGRESPLTGTPLMVAGVQGCLIPSRSKPTPSPGQPLPVETAGVAGLAVKSKSADQLPGRIGLKRLALRKKHRMRTRTLSVDTKRCLAVAAPSVRVILVVLRCVAPKTLAPRGVCRGNPSCNG